MTRLDRLSAGLGLCGLALLAPAGASTTGHVGVFSEYVFRGIVANGGVAVQGGIDHLHDSGLLGGVWATNTTGFGGSEFDLYVGYLHQFTDTVMMDIGALYYILTEDKESALYDFDGDGTPDRTDLDTLEFYTSLYVGPVKLQAYYSDDYVGTNEEAFYYTGSYTHNFNDTISVVGQLGYTHGDAAEWFYGDKYLDYSLTLHKTIREGLVFGLGFVDTNLKDEGSFMGGKDEPKVLISAKQTFTF